MFFRDHLVGLPRVDKPTAASTGCSHLISGHPNPIPWSVLTLPQVRLSNFRACEMLKIINLSLKGIHLPLVDTRWRFEVCMTRPRDILLGASITREQSRSSMSGSRPKQPALSICSGFGGPRAFVVRRAGESLPGKHPVVSSGAPVASTRPRRWPKRYSKLPSSRFGHGSWRCGT